MVWAPGTAYVTLLVPELAEWQDAILDAGGTLPEGLSAPQQQHLAAPKYPLWSEQVALSTLCETAAMQDVDKQKNCSRRHDSHL